MKKKETTKYWWIYVLSIVILIAVIALLLGISMYETMIISFLVWGLLFLAMMSSNLRKIANHFEEMEEE